MANDPTYELLVQALRRFRRGFGTFGKERLAADDTLREWVGEGDPDQTWGVISEIIARNMTDVDGDVLAFFISCGWETEGDTLEARLDRYAAKRNVDQRTARRRSDRGAVKVAQILRHALVYTRPLAQFFIFQSGEVVTAWITVHVEEGSDWRRPKVYINERRIKDLDFKLRDGGLNDYLKSSQRLPDTLLNLSVGGLEALVSIRVTWAMPIWPSWDLSAHLADGRLMSRLTVDKEGSAEARIIWYDDEAANTRDRPLEKG